MNLKVLEETFAITRLAADAPVPAWIGGNNLLAVVRTRGELSIICRDDAVPKNLTEVQRGFRAFAVVGTLDFELTGVIAALADPLAKAKIPIFGVSTYDTDHILMRADRLDDAIAVLTAEGHRFV
jgi:hypothetical protein